MTGDGPEAKTGSVAQVGGHPAHARPQLEEGKSDARAAGVDRQERDVAQRQSRQEARPQQVTILPVDNDPRQGPVAGSARLTAAGRHTLPFAAPDAKTPQRPTRWRMLGRARADRQHANRGGDHGHTEAAKRHDASPRQIVLAWLQARSPQMLPIPGTRSPGHAEANVAAASIELSPDEVAAITRGE